MYRIYKITSDHVVDFAAEELKKYLRMMMPRCGEIVIEYKPDATYGFRLGLMQDLGLDVSEARDTELDDIIHIDTDNEGGIIAGSNPRSVLLSVYRYLTINGCRWLFPGIDGEFIPIKDVAPTLYHKMADNRYRGQCNEGAEFQPDMMEIIDFTPKIGMNIFMIEFDNPHAYYKHYYNHLMNQKNREPEPVTMETALQWKRQCEAEIAKRGLQFHDMGHGWTTESFGISVWTKGSVKDLENGAEIEPYLAEIDGKRDFFGGRAVNTNLCLSNPKARAKMVKAISDYAELHTNVDYLHVWMADSCNNHCECEECNKKTPSDWYVMLMNEIDAELIARDLGTRIVFCCYVDTTWPAETEKLNHPERFTLLLGAISRKYTESVSPKLEGIEITKYKKNDIKLLETVDEYIAYAKEWQKRCGMPIFVYEYHFWINQYYDLGMLEYARIIHEDVKGYRSNGIDGMIQDGSQRSYFPNGFCFYTYASTLFDSSLTFREITEDYFSHAYGEEWREVYAFFEKLGGLCDYKYLAGERSANEKIGKYYNPAMAEGYRKVGELVREFSPFAEAHKNMPMRAQTVAYKLLRYYLEYCEGMANALVLKCFGAGKEAVAVYEKFLEDFGKHETEIERWYDQHMAGTAITIRVLKKGEAEFFGV